MFYISSIGSSATNWLSKSLSKHKDIVCFWPSRSFPPIWPGYTYPNIDTWVKDITPEQYIESLVLCEKAVHGEKIFGSVHGYHGIKAKKACEDFNGHFLYIIRKSLIPSEDVELVRYFHFDNLYLELFILLIPSILKGWFEEQLAAFFYCYKRIKDDLTSSTLLELLWN